MSDDLCKLPYMNNSEILYHRVEEIHQGQM